MRLYARSADDAVRICLAGYSPEPCSQFPQLRADHSRQQSSHHLRWRPAPVRRICYRGVAQSVFFCPSQRGHIGRSGRATFSIHVRAVSSFGNTIGKRTKRTPIAAVTARRDTRVQCGHDLARLIVCSGDRIRIHHPSILFFILMITDRTGLSF